jgi:hypothetical protein
MDCKGVTDLIGLPISMYGYFPAMLVANLSGVDSDFSCPFLSKLQLEL